jgi:methionine biosynthesis protein MetW
VVVEELLRIARRAIVSFPNFGHWRVRMSVMFGGRMPVTPTLEDSWFDTPNIHLCTILDFVDLCQAMGVRIEESFALDGAGRRRDFAATSRIANLLSEQALFVLARA